ncbi:MAG: DUF2589 domain-containing protein [Planctomycetaceae bacterium]|jgi:hypothetical protein|nr:DUF2589 domain-containing protein [Planctomycetaceae bacterium]
MKKLFLTFLAVAGIGMSSMLYAQTQTGNDSTTDAKVAPVFQLETKDQENSEASRGLIVTKKFSRRLPQYYSNVTTAEQKEKIYKIQQSYFGLIELLALRIEKLTAERDAQIEAVLMPEQKEKVESQKKAASEKRSSARSKSNETVEDEKN